MTDEKQTFTNIRAAVAKTAKQLEAEGLPPQRAEQKSESTTAGWLAVLTGFLLMVGSGYGVYLLLVGSRDISLMPVILVSIPGGLGLVSFAVGMNLVSRDASPMMAGLGDIVVKVIRAFKGGGGAS